MRIVQKIKDMDCCMCLGKSDYIIIDNSFMFGTTIKTYCRECMISKFALAKRYIKHEYR